MKKCLFWLMLVSGLLALAGLAGCEQAGSKASADNPTQLPLSGNAFRILAGSELKDVADLVVAFGKTQNVDVVFEYSGTLDAVDRLSEQNEFDAAWISHGKYLQLIPAVKGQIKASEKIMYSRVVLGVKHQVAKALGWKTGKTGWEDVVKQSKAGKFRFAMTNPTGSNTGFVALAGLAAELSGKGDALEEKDIPSGKLTEFFAGQTMTAGSSGVLADMFLANPDKVDGIINYESVIRTMATKGQTLDIVIPKEGVITADYPLMLLANSKQADFYQKLVAYLRAETTQKQIAASTFRTPLAGSGTDEIVNELPFPGSVVVVDAILKGFLDSYSKPALSHFVLDVSGSMARDNRMVNLKKAMTALALGDATSAGRFSSFRAREIIKITPFSSRALGTGTYQIGDASSYSQAEREAMARDINGLVAGGGTAIFDTIASIYPGAQEELKKGKRTVSIVLQTDGENTEGADLETFKRFVAEQGEPRVPIFAILYGEGKQNEMEGLASATGGRVFDAKKVNLTRVMKDIRSYQ